MTIIINLDIYIPISLTMIGTLCMTIVLYKKSKKYAPVTAITRAPHHRL